MKPYYRFTGFTLCTFTAHAGSRFSHKTEFFEKRTLSPDTAQNKNKPRHVLRKGPLLSELIKNIFGLDIKTTGGSRVIPRLAEDKNELDTIRYGRNRWLI